MYKRILTGLSLGIVMISALLVHEISAIALLLIIAMFSSIEWRKSFLIPKKKRNVFLIMCALILITGITLAFAKTEDFLRNLNLVLCILCLLQICYYSYTLITNKSPKLFASILSGLLYIILPTISCIYFLLENFNTNKWFILSFIITNWSNDSMAYFGGKTYGKTPLAPTISPKKTIEGSITGLVFGILALLACNLYFQFELSTLHIVILGIALIIAGALGDLFESSLKRLVEIKDSGKLLPGHGGFLDRFDSFYFVLPVGILFIYLIQH
ncbi:MAG: phosphatidate cytidylyltransferase [Saprospiraceae bacterium]